jgi:DNA-binding GntR family transcriptional regulator
MHCSLFNGGDVNLSRNAGIGPRHEAPVSLQDQAYRLLKQMIADGRLRPGERLLESRIAEAFGISRSPARLALQSLESAALVTQHPIRGYEVAGHSAGPVARLERVSLSQPRGWERMYSEVEQALYAHTLFGSTKVSDVKLAEHFGVSRTVTRDVLARMHGVGLVAKDETGHWIANRVTPQRIRDLFELRQLIEPIGLVQAAPQLPLKLLEEIRADVVDALARKRVESTQFDRIETDLHVKVQSFATNRELIQASKRTFFLFGPTRHLVDPLLGISHATIGDALREHLLVIDALRDQDVEAAATALRTHIGAAVDRWLHRFELAAVQGQPALPSYLKHHHEHTTKPRR